MYIFHLVYLYWLWSSKNIPYSLDYKYTRILIFKLVVWIYTYIYVGTYNYWVLQNDRASYSIELS